jgi:predicted RNA-binding Zn-ribbon protein involved in translation (DUF1610 family)
MSRWTSWFVACACLLLFGTVAYGRTWTNRDGKEIEADFIDVDEERATLKLRTGKEVKVRLDLLCDDDQQFLRGLLARRRLRQATLTEGDSEQPAAKLPSNLEEGTQEASEEDTSSTAAAGASDDTDDAYSEEGSGKSASGTKKTHKAETRTWTDLQGNRVTGKFVRIQGSNVMILRGNRPAFTDFWQLSAEDQQYVRELLVSRGQSDLIPKSNPGQVAGNFPAPVYGNPAVGMTPPGINVPGMGPPGTYPRGPADFGPGASMPAMPNPPAPVYTAPSYPSPAPVNPPVAGPSYPGSYPGPSYPGSIPDPRMPYPGSSAPGSGPNYPSNDMYPRTAMPSMPASAMPPPYIPPSSMPSMPTNRQIKICTGCNKEIAASVGAGDHCPHCGVYLTYDETTGKRASIFGGNWSFRGGRGLIKLVVGIAVLVIGTIVSVIGGIARMISGGSGRSREETDW